MNDAVGASAVKMNYGKSVELYLVDWLDANGKTLLRTKYDKICSIIGGSRQKSSRSAL